MKKYIKLITAGFIFTPGSSLIIGITAAWLYKNITGKELPPLKKKDIPIIRDVDIKYKDTDIF